jgi:hypothetical protein
MDKANVIKRWGMAAALLGVVVCLAAAGVLVLRNVQLTAMAQSAPMPPVNFQWQPNSHLEKLAAGKIIDDAKFLKKELDGLTKWADKPTPQQKAEWKTRFEKANSHLKDPRYWDGKEWKQGWVNILEMIYEKIKTKPEVTIESISAVIEYRERGTQDCDTEIDAVIRITVIFSASPVNNILEGELLHRRICTWG